MILNSSNRSSILDPLLVARLATMELRARAVAEGALAGRHRSRRKGRAHEFSGHRPYTPSDDLRFRDWKAHARTDRWVLREEEAEANRRVLLLLDVSASMGFQGPGRLAKARYGAILLAALGYTLVRRGEAVGAALLSDGGVRRAVPVAAGTDGLPALLGLLEEAAPAGRTRLPDSLREALAGERRGAWVVLVSDLWSAGDGVGAVFKELAVRGHEAAVLVPLDPLETELSMEGDSLFRDMETGESLPASPEEVRAAYRSLLAERFARLEREFSVARTPLVRCGTDRPLDESLREFLGRVA